MQNDSKDSHLCKLRRHKYPLQCSAFTFSEDDKPSRLDFAKAKYGGPFTTEQAEDKIIENRLITTLKLYFRVLDCSAIERSS